MLYHHFLFDLIFLLWKIQSLRLIIRDTKSQLVEFISFMILKNILKVFLFFASFFIYHWHKVLVKHMKWFLNLIYAFSFFDEIFEIVNICFFYKWLVSFRFHSYFLLHHFGVSYSFRFWTFLPYSFVTL